MKANRKKWTPGPWKIEDRLISDMLMIKNAEGTRICEVKSFRAIPDDPDTDEADANAKLISAAPELYDTLKKLITELYCSDTISKAKALLERIPHYIEAEPMFKLGDKVKYIEKVKLPNSEVYKNIELIGYIIKIEKHNNEHYYTVLVDKRVSNISRTMKNTLHEDKLIKL